MTEKRLERVTVNFDSESYCLDGEYWESWDNYGEEMADAINKEFNKLADKNKQLKKDLKLIKELKNCDVNEMLELQEENEQLKEELKDYSDANAQLEQQNKLLKNTLTQEQEIMKEIKTELTTYKRKFLECIDKKRD